MHVQPCLPSGSLVVEAQPGKASCVAGAQRCSATGGTARQAGRLMTVPTPTESVTTPRQARDSANSRTWVIFPFDIDVGFFPTYILLMHSRTRDQPGDTHDEVPMPTDRFAPLSLPRPTQARRRNVAAGSPFANGATQRLVLMLVVVAAGLTTVLSAVQPQDAARAAVIENGALRRTAALSAPASVYVPERFRKVPAQYAQSQAAGGTMH